ncbi:TPA: hypothetical protein N0F65_012159 [Lagenidium giganteum]|uniref:Uncharacterized protein n=1 Tax=Lagenidium giganteum TaxID=4803 RepID=A0AAV2YX61_9STRA|nr:TPA: hypothetical protein N0F65_012159 [Lagenidium giganteum]
MKPRPATTTTYGTYERAADADARSTAGAGTDKTRGVRGDGSWADHKAWGRVAATLWRRLAFTWVGDELAQSLPPMQASNGVSQVPWDLGLEERSAVAKTQFVRVYLQSKSVWKTVIRTQWPLVVSSGLLTLAAVACELLAPVSVFVVVNLAAHSMERHLLWFAFWMLVLLSSRFCRSYLLQFANYQLERVLVRSLGAVQVMLLDSMLLADYKSIKKDARTEFNRGSAANLFTSDMHAVASAIIVLHRAWAVPLELLGLTGLMYWIIGPSVLIVLLLWGLLYALVQVITGSEANVFRHWLQLSDLRFGVLHRIFSDLLGIKLNSWEEHVVEKLLSLREKEQQVLSRVTLLRSVRYALMWAAPAISLIGIAAVFSRFPNSSLDSTAKTFATVAIVHAINNAFASGLEYIQTSLQYRVSMNRITERLETIANLEEARRKSNDSGLSDEEEAGELPEIVVDVVNGCFAAPRTGEVLLNCINLSVRRGEFVVIRGKVGAGKSVLLRSILGLQSTHRGSVQVYGKVAYCTQEPWLQTGSIRDNILFGQPYDRTKYINVLNACGVAEEIQRLPSRDDTWIGSNGMVSLSRGQEARVALARACYADADVYVLDSPLDNVDSIVQCDVLLKCFGTLLQAKTIILVTHNPEIIRSELVDRVITLEDMVINATSCFTRSNRRAPSHRPFVSKRVTVLDNSQTLTRRTKITRSVTTSLVLQPIDENRSDAESNVSAVPRPPSMMTRLDCKTTLKDYLSYTGSVSCLNLVVLLHFLAQAVATCGIYWFSRWASSYGCLTMENCDRREFEGMWETYFHVFVWCVVVACVLYLGASYATFMFSLRAAGKLFQCMTSALLHAPMGFFARNSVGKILNRYARDLTAVDSRFQEAAFDVLRGFFVCFCSIFATFAWLVGHVVKKSQDLDGMNVWLLRLGLVPLNIVVTSVVLIAFWRQAIHLNGPWGYIYMKYRESQSPLFTFASETLAGSQVIMAFGSTVRQHTLDTYATHVDTCTQWYWAMRCFQIRLAVMNFARESLLTGAMLMLVVLFGHDSSPTRPSTIGLLLFLILNARRELKSAYMQWNALETNIVSIQRLLEYVKIPSEGEGDAVTVVDTARQDPYWPRHGSIEFKSLCFQYHPGCDVSSGVSRPACSSEHLSILQDINVSIRSGEKVAVVGQSGAGKTTLGMAIMRVANPISGSIVIDGVDITHVHIKTLRSKISYVSPTPVFSSQTIREYLDPFNEVSDGMLWSILGDTKAHDAMARTNSTLDSDLDDFIDTWSPGQRQLLCLSRALLHHSRIVILDEATASTDQETDDSIHQIIADIFDADTTLLCISHRLDDLLDFDKILMLSKGRLVDFGTAAELVEHGNSEFLELLENAPLSY